MSKPRKSTARRSPTPLILSWLVAVFSIALAYFFGRASVAAFGSLRSCASTTIAQASNCGKQSLNAGDLMLVALLVLSLLFMLSAVTHAWRLTRGHK